MADLRRLTCYPDLVYLDLSGPRDGQVDTHTGRTAVSAGHSLATGHRVDSLGSTRVSANCQPMINGSKWVNTLLWAGENTIGRKKKEKVVGDWRGEGGGGVGGEVLSGWKRYPQNGRNWCGG